MKPLLFLHGQAPALCALLFTRQQRCCAALLLLLVLLLPVDCAAGPLRISILVSPAVLENPVARAVVDDCLQLLRQAFPAAGVGVNAPGAGIRIRLPDGIRDAEACLGPPDARPYRCTPVPDASYRWTSARRGRSITLRLAAAAPEGIASGLYGLLQEKLGFRFHHPRQSIIPRYGRWPLPERFVLRGEPRFEKRGFHLHTLHPTELTEQLHDPAYPGAYGDITAYLDWLARNGQNRFQFFLLRGIDRDTWPAHARRIVEYAHRRGIRCGVEISLAMIQQQAFQALTLLRPYPSYTRQVDQTLSWLFRAPWDFITLEATMGEHLPILDRLLPGVQEHLEQQVEERYGARLMYATHVICPSSGDRVRRPQRPASGMLIHTVMCYSASEERAPVYGNSNQRFMLEAAAAENRRRETWYWPESSYWVGFDSSVPLLLLPYLDARRSDMEIMGAIGVSGHLTFSSGWEWGYWLVDWSIARWSWRVWDNGRERPVSALSRLHEITGNPGTGRLWQEALDLQIQYLKDRELMRFMAALAPFSELPPPFDKPFQPEPGFRYGWLLRGAGRQQADAVLNGPVGDLEQYAARMGELVQRLESAIGHARRRDPESGARTELARELARGLRVTALRARHRAATLRALLARRGDSAGVDGARPDGEELLRQAARIRREAWQLVAQQERHYRYPPDWLARRRASLTAYPFGYLYPAATLFFWEREEEQVRRERFDALFMNLWDLRRTLGLESLFFRP